MRSDPESMSPKSVSPINSRWQLAAILKFVVFEKILKHAIIIPKSSVTPLDICFWGHRIHFWCYFSDSTKITQNGGRKYPFLAQNGQNLE